MLDPAPRVVLDPELGLVTVGATAADAPSSAEIYAHTIDVIERAERLEEWQALPAATSSTSSTGISSRRSCECSATPPPFAGEVALVTGAASGIGRACVDGVPPRGAAVVGLDLDPSSRTATPAASSASSAT